ncbi:hypothetical protein G9A89_018805 [Geosiphon pyriformis]|nr:hypothetical protein G9A89_018805 [Geosiphon pyriformis]
MFTTMKQEETEAVTTYLECFHRNLHQIQAIQADYFTAPQILNQFIRDLCSSILQCICPLHLADLQAAVTNAKDFEAAELEANHAQAINLIINELSELDSKLKQFKDILFDNMETNQIQPLTSNILPAVSTKDESLATILPFDFDEITLVPLFSKAILNTKLITAMYTDAKVDG